MSEKKKGTGVPARRRLLRQTLAGGGLVGISAISGWSTPVIKSIALPAHASTSDTASRSFARFSLVQEAADGNVDIRHSDKSRLAQTIQAITNSIVPIAKAQQSPHRRFALIEKPAARFDFYLLESESVGDDCTSEHLFVARDVAPFEPIVTQWHICDGHIMSGPELELIDVIDSEATVNLSEVGRFTLQRDSAASPLGIMPCPPCLEEG